MSNQLQLSEPKAYRAASLREALRELFDELIAPPKRQVSPPRAMTLAQLRDEIAQTIHEWAGDAVRVETAVVEEAERSHHYADFWLQVGKPVAALFAIPEEPDERHEAWMRRDSIPTVAAAFRALNPAFTAVAVLPPNGHQPSAFAAETQRFLGAIDGVKVTHVDQLPGLRGEILPSML